MTSWGRGNAPRPFPLLWHALGLGLCGVGLATVAGVAFGEYAATYWRILSSAGIALVCESAWVSGVHLSRTRRLDTLGQLLRYGSPVAAAILLVGVWQDVASRAYVQVTLTAAILLLAGLTVGTARLVACGAAAEATFRALAALVAAIAVLSLVLTWWGETPEPLLSALLGLVGATVVLYLATPLITRLERR